jgi:ABC-type protease/lipase transport system fused ATPase/permease subunit
MATDVTFNINGNAERTRPKSSLKPFIAVTLLFSLVVNFLMLVSPLYMPVCCPLGRWKH